MPRFERMVRHFFTIVLFARCVTVHAEGFVGIEPGTCTYRKWSRDGDVKLLVVAGLHENNGGRCGQWSEPAVRGAVALDWMLAKLNGNLTNRDPYIPGVTIGYDLYDNCDHPDVTTDLLFSGSSAGQKLQCSGDKEPYVAILSLTNIESTRVISHVTQPALLLRPLPTAPGLEEHPAAIQNVASFQQEAQAIVAFLTHHNWNMIIVVHTADEYGTKSSAFFRDIARKSEICVHLMAEPTANTVKDLYAATQLSINSTIALVFFGDQQSADDFVQKSEQGPVGSRIIWIFSSLVNTKPAIRTGDHFFAIQYPAVEFVDFTSYYNSISTTDSPLQDIALGYGSLKEANGVTHVVDAVLSIANSVKKAGCLSGQGCDIYPGIVGSNVKVDEEFLNDYIPLSYRGADKTIRYSNDRFQEISTLIVTDGANEVGSFNMQSGFTSLANFRTTFSACKGVCTGCRDKHAIRYSYLDGDVLILGLFSLRTYGDTPYSCGVFRGTCTDTTSVSAFMEYILSRRRADSIHYGGIALDDCYNGLNTTHLLTDLFSKKMIIRDPNTDDAIDFDKVVLIIGALSSPVSITVADFATSAGLPMISYGASTPELDNRNRYPYFFRTVPSDSQQVEGIIKLITEIGVTHVGAVYIDDSYGKTGILKLQQGAASQHICVRDPLAVTQTMTDRELVSVIDELYRQQVRVVVYFSIDRIADSLLKLMPGSDKKRAPLIFIASEAWGLNRNAISGDLGKKAIGTIVFNIANLIDLNSEFEQYLLKLNFTEKKHNRWIPKMFEDYNKCNLITSFEKVDKVGDGVKICGADFQETMSAEKVASLYVDQRVVHVSHAVQAATEGFKVFCASDTSIQECRSRVRQETGTFASKIADVTYKGTRLFDSDQNGNIGFTVYNIQLDEVGGEVAFRYIQIGTYSTDGRLTITRDPVFYNDVQKNISLSGVNEVDCTNYGDKCPSVCLFPTTSPVPPTTTSSVAPEPQADGESNTMLVITIVLAVLLAILGVALVLIIVVLLRRSPNKGDKQGFSMEHRRSIDNTYAVVSGESRYSMPSSVRSAVQLGGNAHRYSPKTIDYADIRHQSYPDIRMNHVRQMSSPEVLQTTTFSTPRSNPRSRRNVRNVRPKSNHSAPGSESMSPKTPHSGPNISTLDRNFRYKPQSSPRFRYPNAQAESKYTYPNDMSPNTLHRAEGNFNLAMDEESIQPQSLASSHNGYLTMTGDANLNSKTEPKMTYLTDDPSGGSTNEGFVPNDAQPESKLTYLTAADLVRESSEDEEDVEMAASADDTGYLSGNTNASSKNADTGLFENCDTVAGTASASNSDAVLKKHAYNPQLQSPSDTEVSKINFPSSSAASPKSLTEMPDVLRHGPYEEEEDNVFII